MSRFSWASGPSICRRTSRWGLVAIVLTLGCLVTDARSQPPTGRPPSGPSSPSEPPAASASRATEAGRDDGETGTPKFREETIYIPYRKLQQVFEKEGRGVFLPYEKFQALWKAAQAKVEREKPKGEPVAAVIREIESRAVIGKQIVDVEATVQIEVLRKGWVTIPLRLKNSAIRSATLEGRSARIVFDAEHGYQFLHRNDRGGPQSLTLKLNYSRAFSKTPGRSEVTFEPPQAPIHRWEVSIDEADVSIEVQPLIAATKVDDSPAGEAGATKPKSTRMLAFVGAAPTVSIRWNPRVEGAAGLAAFVSAQLDQRVDIGKGVVRSSVQVLYEISRAPLNKLELDVPLEYKIVNIYDRNIKRWDVKSEAGRQRISVELFDAVQGKQSLTLELELYRQAEETRFAVELPMIRALQVGRQQGWVLVDIEDALRGEVVRRVGLTQVDPSELPAARRKQKWDFAYRYSAVPYAATLNVAAVEPRVSVTQRIEVGLTPDSLEVGMAARFHIEDAGVFQLYIDVSDGLEVRAIRGAAIGKSVRPAAVESFHRESDDKPTWVVNLSKKALGDVGLVVQTRRSLAIPELATATGKSVDVAIDVPRATMSKIEFSSGSLILRAPESLRVNPKETKGLRPISLEDAYAHALPELKYVDDEDEEAGLAFAVAHAPVRLTVAAARRKPLVTVTQILQTTFEPGVVKYATSFLFDIRFSGIKSVRIDVPTALEGSIHNASPALRRSEMSPQPDDVPNGYTAWSFAAESEMMGQRELRLTWEQQIGDLNAGASQTVALPRLIPQGVDRSTGQILVTKAEGIDIVPSGTPTGLRPIDPERDLDERIDADGVAMAFEFVGEWELELTAQRYQPAPVKLTAVERGVVRAVVLPNDRLSVQVVYLIKSARQRLSIKLPAKAEFDSQPMRINGRPVTPESGPGGTIFAPLAAQDPDTAFVLEMRYSVEGGPGRIELPAFPEDPAVQKVYLIVFLPEKMELIASRGDWSYEMAGSPLPWRVVSRRDRNELTDPLRWACGDVHSSYQAASSFPVGRGRRYVYSTLRPAPPPNGDLQLTVARRGLLQVAVIVLIAVVGLPLVGRSLRSQLIVLLLLSMFVFLLGVFRSELLSVLTSGLFPGAVGVLVLVWLAGHIWVVGRGSWRTLPFEQNASRLVAQEVEQDVESAAGEGASDVADERGGPGDDVSDGESDTDAAESRPSGGADDSNREGENHDEQN